MRNKFIIMGIILTAFLGVNFNNFTNFYYNVSGKYEETNNSEGKYNIGTSFYIENNFEKSINSFSGLLDEKNKELYFRLSYNLANSYYKFGEGKNLDDRIDLYTKSVENYREVLTIKFDEETQKNLEFVEEKLRLAKLEKKKESSPQPSPEGEGGEQNENQDKQEGGEDSGENKESEKEDKSEEEGASEENKGEETGEEEGGSQGEETDEGLSDETKNILEKKAEELEDLQEQIGKFYNKTYDEKSDPFSLFNDSFDNSLLDDNEEKDW